MEENLLNLNNKIYSSNNILPYIKYISLKHKLIKLKKNFIKYILEIITDLNQLKNSTNYISMIKRLSKSINKINYIINENTKNLELLQRNLIELIQKLSQYKTPKKTYPK